MSFKLCHYCKERAIRDRESMFSSSVLCGDCIDARNKFIEETKEGLKEAFLFQLGKDPSDMNLCYLLERKLKEQGE